MPPYTAQRIATAIGSSFLTPTLPPVTPCSASVTIIPKAKNMTSNPCQPDTWMVTFRHGRGMSGYVPNHCGNLTPSMRCSFNIPINQITSITFYGKCLCSFEEQSREMPDLSCNNYLIVQVLFTLKQQSQDSGKAARRNSNQIRGCPTPSVRI